MLLIKNFAAIIILMFCEFGWGALVLKIIKYPRKSDSMYFIFSLAFGHGVLAYIILAMAALGQLYKSSAVVILVVSFLVSGFEIYRNKHSIINLITSKPIFPKNWFSWLLLLSIIISVIFPIIAEALFPASNWDEVAYHLAIPKIYIHNHQLTYIPYIPYSNWPLETEMLYTLCLLLQWESGCHMVVWSDLILICCALYIFGKKYYSGQSGLIAAAIFASTPMVMILAGTGLIELPLTLFTMLATLALIEWNETGELSLWVISAMSGGLAASTKLNAALVPLILGIVFVLMMIKHKERFFIICKNFIGYGLIAFLVVAPWYIKSWIFTGNPFWPFLYQFIPSANWDAQGMDYLMSFIRSPNMPSTFYNWVTGLIQLTIHPEKFGPFRIALGEKYLLFIPFVFFVALFSKAKHIKVLRWLLLCAVIFYTSWFFQTHQTRFFMPVTPIIALLAGLSLSWIFQFTKDKSKITSSFLQFALVILLFSTSWLVTPADRSKVVTRFPYLLGNMSRNEYLSTQIAGYEAFQFINKNLPQNAQILMALYEVRGYYLDREYVWANPISQREIHFEEYGSASELAQSLKNIGITHILFDPKDAEKFSYIKYGDKISNLMNELITDHAKILLQTGSLDVYKLTP